MFFRWILIAIVSMLSATSYAAPAPCTECAEQPSMHTLATAVHGWQINTHNTYKQKELNRLFGKHGQNFEFSTIDLNEIDSDPINVIAHKASQLGEYVLVEDTSLDIDGADIGVNLRWKKDELHHHVGKKAIWRVLIAYRAGDCVFVYKGEQEGTIVQPREKKGYGFHPIFQPKGSTKTLAELSNDEYNARAAAVDNFMKNNYHTVVKALYNWDGPWQHDEG